MADELPSDGDHQDSLLEGGVAQDGAFQGGLPDRLSTNPQSPFYNEALLQRGIGIRFKGVEKTNVDEYCVSEGWVRVQAGKGRDRAGNPMTLMLKGPVEPYLRDEAEQPGETPAG